MYRQYLLFSFTITKTKVRHERAPRILKSGEGEKLQRVERVPKEPCDRKLLIFFAYSSVFLRFSPLFCYPERVLVILEAFLKIPAARFRGTWIEFWE